MRTTFYHTFTLLPTIPNLSEFYLTQVALIQKKREGDFEQDSCHKARSKLEDASNYSPQNTSQITSVHKGLKGLIT